MDEVDEAIRVVLFLMAVVLAFGGWQAVTGGDTQPHDDLDAACRVVHLDENTSPAVDDHKDTRAIAAKRATCLAAQGAGTAPTKATP